MCRSNCPTKYCVRKPFQSPFSITFLYFSYFYPIFHNQSYFLFHCSSISYSSSSTCQFFFSLSSISNFGSPFYSPYTRSSSQYTIEVKTLSLFCQFNCFLPPFVRFGVYTHVYNSLYLLNFLSCYGNLSNMFHSIFMLFWALFFQLIAPLRLLINPFSLLTGLEHFYMISCMNIRAWRILQLCSLGIIIMLLK
jgi:hypothetical protein